MNKIASKWMIGALALAVIVITVSFMLIQGLAVDKNIDKHDMNAGYKQEIELPELSPEEQAEVEQRINELKEQGLIKETVNPDGTKSASFGGQ
ncbi:hypothetical protein JNUCC42_16370 [Brevibacterium sp. JNUCC-42]|nr:hypothetical protein JNUCC42_16370 [Brevibacterium sp. JNUCC-42]